MKNKKRIAVIIAVVMLTLSMASTGFAKTAMETLTAYYRNITIFRNGTQATFTHEPFIVDGTTYVPVRDMSELLGKTVTFNPTTYRIDITDNADSGTIALQTKVVQQEITIKNLESQIATLKAQLADKEEAESEMDLDEMEDFLNEEYEEYKNVEFSIRLKGDEDDVDIQISVDLDDFYEEWDNLSTTQIKSYISSIVNDYLDEFDDADVEGFIEDSSMDEELVSFYVNSKGTLVYDFEGSSDSDDDDDIKDIADMEEFLDDKYSDSDGIERVELEEEDDDIYIIVQVTKTQWNDLDEDEQYAILEEMYEDIRYEDFDNTIYGEIRTYPYGSLLYEFEYDSSGNVGYVD
ncbi:hypothetical protein E9840_11540 [Tissierella creatinini]|nr:hypothetical protein E9840_11540 [Tissierella creatinini]TJX61076.1 hypothetical protein E8P77_18845 [Soehngenia saccharolytica]